MAGAVYTIKRQRQASALKRTTMKLYESKAFIGILALICISLISCKNDKSDVCINEIVNSKNNILITQDEIEVINDLNRSPYDIHSNIQIYGLIENSDNGLRVKCYQFSNNLNMCQI